MSHRHSVDAILSVVMVEAATAIETSLRGTVSTLLFVGRFFCAAPPIDWTPSATAAECRRRSIWRWLHQIYAAVYLCIVAIVFHGQFCEVAVDGALSEKIISITRHIMYFLIYVLIVLGVQWQRTQYASFVRQMVVIDALLDGRRQPIIADNRALRRFLHCSLVALLVATCGAAVVDFFAYDGQSLGASLRSIVVFLGSNVTVCLAMLQLSAGLWWLRSRYALLNEVLVLADGEAGVRQLRRLRIQLNGLHERLTGSFGWLIVGMQLQTVLDLTVQMFMVYRYAGRLEGALNRWLAVYTVLWLGVHAGKAALLAWFSDRVEREVGVFNEWCEPNQLNAKTKFT